MDWIAVAIAGLCGALAALVAQLLIGFNNKERRGFYAVLFVVVFLVVRYGAKIYVEPNIRLWDTERQLKEMTVFNELAIHDPIVFHRLSRTIEESTKSGAPKQELYLKATDMIVDIFPRFVPKASDDSIVAYAKLVVRELKTLDQINPDACYGLLFPHSVAPGFATKYMDEKYKKDSLVVLGDIVKSAVENPQGEPSEDRADEVLQPVYLGMAQKYGNDIALINEAKLDSSGRKKVCEMTSAMFEEISALPKPDASLALRYLLSSKGSKTSQTK